MISAFSQMSATQFDLFRSALLSLNSQAAGSGEPDSEGRVAVARADGLAFNLPNGEGILGYNYLHGADQNLGEIAMYTHVSGTGRALPCWVSAEVVPKAENDEGLFNEMNELQRVGFDISLDEFKEMWSDAESYPQFDWTNDGCSDRGAVTFGSFGCIRHDWIYRNTRRVDAVEEDVNVDVWAY